MRATLTIVVCCLSALTALPAPATAQQNSLKGRSCLELSLGLWVESQARSVVSTGGVEQTASTNGFLGALEFTYWTTEQMAWGLSAGVLSAKVTSSVSLSGVSQSASAIIPVLAGVKYHLSSGDLSSPRFFLAGFLGPVIGTQAENTATEQSATTSTALGLKPGIGVDLFFGSSFKVAVEGGYFLTTEFSEPIGGRTSYSGPFFTLSLGFVFGSATPPTP
jgi:outer membrane protein W